MGSSQAFSLEIMLAIVVFISTILVFYPLLSYEKEETADELQNDAEIIIKNIESENLDIGIIKGTKVDEAKLTDLFNKEYPDIKKEIRVESDFCIFLEKKDGSVIYIDPSKPGVGSDNIFVAEVECK